MLTSTQSQGPRRRFRGKRRYFRHVQRTAEAFQLEPSGGDGWDLWHYHADWRGWGNLRWRHRKEHIRALARVFATIAASADRFTRPFQTWIYLDGGDAGQDATYLHTPNPNQSPFPVQLFGVEWGNRNLLPLFAELLPNFPVRIGEARLFTAWAEPPRVTTSFFIYCPGIGVPLEADREVSL